MKKASWIAVAALAGLSPGCQKREVALLKVDKDTVLTADVENGPVDTRTGFSVTGAEGNHRLHRVLRKSDGSVLFAYDAEIHNGEQPGSYKLTVSPVKGSPTFSTSREVSATVDQDEIRMELVEDSVSHRKIVDVLKFSTNAQLDPMNSLIRFHNHIFRMVHGK